MARKLPSDIHLSRFALAFIEILLIVPFIFECTEASPIDTLDLQLQWAYPIQVRDMKLVDFNNDGINEILVGFKSDSSRVGILDEQDRQMIWYSPGIDFDISTVSAGDRNKDGCLDIICGGQKWNYPDPHFIGRFEIFDGPAYDSIHSFSGFDQKVLSADISTYQDTMPKFFIGTQLDTSYSSGYMAYYDKRLGKLYVLNGYDFTVQNISNYGSIREISLRDINNDTREEMFLGMDSWETYVDYLNPVDNTGFSAWIVESTSYNSRRFNLCGWAGQGAYAGDVSFDALETGSFTSSDSTCIIGAGHYYVGTYLRRGNSRLLERTDYKPEMEY